MLLEKPFCPSVYPTFDQLSKGTFFQRKATSSDVIFHCLSDQVSTTTPQTITRFLVVKTVQQVPLLEISCDK